MTRMFHFFHSHDAGEPAHDERLGALLRDAVGEPPMGDVDWGALAGRIGATVRAQQAAPWWSYAEQWQRRALPLAVAAALVGALALWSGAGAGAGETVVSEGPPDFLSAVVSGAPADDAARSFARTLTSPVDFAAAVPE
jgi:hypothetical protein